MTRQLTVGAFGLFLAALGGECGPATHRITVTRRMCCAVRGGLDGLADGREDFFEDWAKLESQMPRASKCAQQLTFYQKLSEGTRARRSGVVSRDGAQENPNFRQIQRYSPPAGSVPTDAQCIQLEAEFKLHSPLVRKYDADFITPTDVAFLAGSQSASVKVKWGSWRDIEDPQRETRSYVVTLPEDADDEEDAVDGPLIANEWYRFGKKWYSGRPSEQGVFNLLVKTFGVDEVKFSNQIVEYFHKDMTNENRNLIAVCGVNLEYEAQVFSILDGADPFEELQNGQARMAYGPLSSVLPRTVENKRTKCIAFQFSQPAFKQIRHSPIKVLYGPYNDLKSGRLHDGALAIRGSVMMEAIEKVARAAYDLLLKTTRPAHLRVCSDGLPKSYGSVDGYSLEDHFKSNTYPRFEAGQGSIATHAATGPELPLPEDDPCLTMTVFVDEMEYNDIPADQLGELSVIVTRTEYGRVRYALPFFGVVGSRITKLLLADPKHKSLKDAFDVVVGRTKPKSERRRHSKSRQHGKKSKSKSKSRTVSKFMGWDDEDDVPDRRRSSSSKRRGSSSGSRESR